MHHSSRPQPVCCRLVTQAEILRRHRLDSSDALLAWIDAQNTKRRSLSDDWITDESAHGPKSVSAREKALKKVSNERGLTIGS